MSSENQEECIACKYSGVDEQEYLAHGCPECTCKHEKTILQIGEVWRHKGKKTCYEIIDIGFTSKCECCKEWKPSLMYERHGRRYVRSIGYFLTRFDKTVLVENGTTSL